MTNLKTNIYLLFWFLFIAVFAFLIPYYSNDYRYQLVEGTDDLVGSIADIFVSQYRHYFTWGGRTPPHLLAQFLLYSGKYVSALATAFCYLGLIYIIYIFGIGRRVNPLKLPFVYAVFVTMGLWICLRSYGEVIFMLVTSCNYLFTTVFIMAFLLPFRFSLEEQQKSHSFLFAAMMFILGIVAGWCNENTGFSICFCTGLLCLYLFLRKKLTLWQIAGLCGMGIGFLILVLSPGNAVRLEHMEESSNFNYFHHIFSAFLIFLLSLLENLPLLAVYIYLRYLCFKNRISEKNSNAVIASDYAFALGFISLAIMIFSPNFPGRSAAPFTFFVLASLVTLFKVLSEHNISVFSRKLLFICAGCCFVFFAVTAANACGALMVARADDAVMKQEINDQIKAGFRDIVLSPLHVQSSRYIFIGDTRVSKKYFANIILSRYYHVNSVSKKCDFVKTVWHSDLIYYQHYGKVLCKAE